MKKLLGLLLVVAILLLGLGCSGEVTQNISWDPSTEPDFDGLHWGISPLDVRERLEGRKLKELDGFYTVDNVKYAGIDCYKNYFFNTNNELNEVSVHYLVFFDSMVANINQHLTDLYGEPEVSELEIGSDHKVYKYCYRTERTLVKLTHTRSATDDLIDLRAEYFTEN